MLMLTSRLYYGDAVITLIRYCVTGQNKTVDRLDLTSVSVRVRVGIKALNTLDLYLAQLYY